jgi:hypothetical protein
MTSPFVRQRAAELLNLISLSDSEYKEMRYLQDAETVRDWDVETVRVVTDSRGRRCGAAHIFKVKGRIHEVETILHQMPDFVKHKRLIWRIIPTRPEVRRATREVEPPNSEEA